MERREGSRVPLLLGPGTPAPGKDQPLLVSAHLPHRALFFTGSGTGMGGELWGGGERELSLTPGPSSAHAGEQGPGHFRGAGAVRGSRGIHPSPARVRSDSPSLNEMYFCLFVFCFSFLGFHLLLSQACIFHYENNVNRVAPNIAKREQNKLLNVIYLPLNAINVLAYFLSGFCFLLKS